MQIAQSVGNYSEISLRYSHQVRTCQIKTNANIQWRIKFDWRSCIYYHLPLFESFLVFMIFAANSLPVLFCTHRRTTEKAPLKQLREQTYVIMLYNCHSGKW